MRAMRQVRHLLPQVLTSTDQSGRWQQLLHDRIMYEGAAAEIFLCGGAFCMAVAE